jgi:hypothetical protein
VFPKVDISFYHSAVPFCLNIVAGRMTVDALSEEVSSWAPSFGLSHAESRATLRSFVHIFRLAVRNGCTAEEIAEDFKGLGASEEVATWVGTEWAKRVREVTEGVVRSSMTVSPLRDMDWRFGGVYTFTDVSLSQQK